MKDKSGVKIMNTISAEIDGKKYIIELFNHPIALKILQILPLTIDLTCWGNEAYGEIPLNTPSVSPQSTIPPGGIAFSEKGSYLCLFYGQTPAWPVDYIGRFEGESWKSLINGNFKKLIIKN